MNRRVHGLIEALRRSGQFERAIVLVHGDHGSRISQMSLGVQKNLTSDDLRDAYSTSFAVKAPGIAPGYDTGLLRQSATCSRALRQGRAAAPILDPAWPPPPVYLFAARGEKANIHSWNTRRSPCPVRRRPKASARDGRGADLRGPDTAQSGTLEGFVMCLACRGQLRIRVESGHKGIDSTKSPYGKTSSRHHSLAPEGFHDLRARDIPPRRPAPRCPGMVLLGGYQ